MPVVFADFQPVLLSAPIPQEQVVNALARCMAVARCVRERIVAAEAVDAVHREVAERMARFGVSPSHIAQRQVGIARSSYLDPNCPDGGSPYPLTHAGLLDDPAGDTCDQRLRAFEEAALSVFAGCYEDDATPPDDVVHVTCSGYALPSPAQTFLSKRGWQGTGVTHSYHMGCYGAFPAIRTALGLIGASYASLPRPKQRVDIVHTEYLSLHLDLVRQAPDNFVIASLFGDGHIKYSAYPLVEFRRQEKHGLMALAMHETLIPGSLDEMTLRPGRHVFDMTLSKRVPLTIRESIEQFMVSLCAQAGVDFEREKDRLVYAVHPGGPAILDAVRDALGLPESKMQFSREVLRRHGNMASATAPHIWKEIVEADEVPVGAKVVSVAFGPGLTTTGAVFAKV